MTRHRLRSGRSSRRLAWLGLLALLLQQVALLAYACPVADMPPEASAMIAGCEGMEMPDPEAAALCDQHCVRDHVANPSPQAPQVPPAAPPPPYYDLSAALLPSAQAQYYEDVPVCRSDPPAAQRFCSLQI